MSYAPSFAYQDFQYFLTQGNGPWGNRTWTYDKIGNRLTFARSGEPTQTYAYASPGHNPKLSTITPAPGWGTGAWILSYDAAGNQTSIAESNNEGAVQTTVYDFAGDSRMNALRTASPTGPARTDLLYDGRGFLRQAHLTVTGSGDNVKVTPVYSSAGMLMARTEERTWTGGTTGPDGEDQPFAWLVTDTTQLFYFAGRPVAQLTNPGAELLYLTTDHLGTPALVTNGGGTATWAGGLEPFRAPWTAGLDRPDPEPVSSGDARFRFATAALERLSVEKVFLRYPGQWSSDAFRVGAAQGDVYYNVNRWYAAGTGRYERPDPWTKRSEQSLQLYGYGEARPTYFSDPLGLCSCSDDCPSGEWDYAGVSWAWAFGGGIQFTAGEFQCRGSLSSVKVPVWAACGLVGLGAGIGYEIGTPLVPAACGCNKGDLFGRSISASAGSNFSLGLGACGEGGGLTRTTGGSVGGRAFLLAFCHVKPR